MFLCIFILTLVARCHKTLSQSLLFVKKEWGEKTHKDFFDLDWLK